MKNNIYFLIRSLLISLLFFLLLPLHSFASDPCPNNCSGNGFCHIVGTTPLFCICDTGWKGDNCTIPESSAPTSTPITPTTTSCPNNCSDHGFCSSDGCICEYGWTTSSDCSMPTIAPCPNNCSDHGFCSSDGCICEYGWSGSECSIPTCPNNCSDNGICHMNGSCFCDTGWSGSDCSLPFCPNNCSYHGYCAEGGCSCSVGWTGSDCSVAGSFVPPPSDGEIIQAIQGNLQNAVELDNRALQKIKEGDYPSTFLIINTAINLLTKARDSVQDIDALTADFEFKINRLLESSIDNHKKASSNIDRIVNDPKVEEYEGLLAKLLKNAKRFINNALLNDRKAQHAVLSADKALGPPRARGQKLP